VGAKDAAKKLGLSTKIARPVFFGAWPVAPPVAAAA
jgi:hypothetical protein